MRSPRVRFTVRRMMVAVAIVAALMGAHAVWTREDEPLLQFDDQALADKHLISEGRAPGGSRSGDRLPEVSLIQLIANPDLYHDKPVRVHGFLHAEFEGTALYLSRDDANHLITRNGLWISFGRDLATWKSQGISPRRFNRKFVLIEGVFDKGLVGHMGSWSGGIREIWRVMEAVKYYDD